MQIDDAHNNETIQDLLRQYYYYQNEMITIVWTINNKMIKTKRASKFVPAEESDGKRLLIVFDPHWAKFHKVPFH